MSGGVDSSVAAALLRADGHDVIGLFMRHGETAPHSACSASTGSLSSSNLTNSNLSSSNAPSGNLSSGSDSARVASAGAVAAVGALPIVRPRGSHKQGCCSATDADDARRVADRLGIPFYALDFAEPFGRIMDYFVAEYSAGRTPNPCVVCNTWLKFGRLIEFADDVGARYVATGHYARLLPATEPEGPPALHQGLDRDKDQSYVLFGIERRLLARIWFPVGSETKDQIRARAQALGLGVADKPDSQEICFVPDGDHARFVRERRGGVELAGEIVTTEGRVVGHHTGLEQFTVGQRKGLGVALGEPRYVVRLEPESRRVVIGTHDELARDALWAREANWLVDVPAEPFEARVKIRYRSSAVPATILVADDRRMQVRFAAPQRGVAPGQAVVVYDGTRVLGGGWIE